MLVGVERLLEQVITGQDHDDGEVLVDESQHTVLELTGHDGLAVKVGNFLDLQGTLKSGGELAATTQEQQRLLVLESLGAELLDGLVKGKDVLDLARDLAETLHDLETSLGLGCTVLAKRQGKHDHGDELRSVGLGGGDTNLGSGVDVDTTVGEQRDGRTDDVDDTDGQSTTLQAVAESHQGVGSLTGLRDEHASVVTEDGSLSVQEVGSQLDRDGDLSKLFEDTSNSHAGVITSAASNEDDTTTSSDSGNV